VQSALPSLPSAAALGLGERVDRFEADLIRATLRDAGGDVRRAIEILQLPRKTFARPSTIS
jgi:two-component system C4-dicarboxylate transport response regulator DctD